MPENTPTQDPEVMTEARPEPEWRLTPRPYHRRFRHLDRRAIALTRDAVHAARDDRLWDGDAPGNEQVALQAWAEALAAVYHVPVPQVRVRRNAIESYRPNWAAVEGGSGLIEVPRFSAISFLHEFRHHLQTEAGEEISEEDARAWSLSLFFRACPRRYRRMVCNRRVLFMQAEVPFGAPAPEQLVGKTIASAARTGNSGELLLTATDGSVGLVSDAAAAIRLVIDPVFGSRTMFLRAEPEAEEHTETCPSCAQVFLAADEDDSPTCPHCGEDLGVADDDEEAEGDEAVAETVAGIDAENARLDEAFAQAVANDLAEAASLRDANVIAEAAEAAAEMAEEQGGPGAEAARRRQQRIASRYPFAENADATAPVDES